MGVSYPNFVTCCRRDETMLKTKITRPIKLTLSNDPVQMTFEELHSKFQNALRAQVTKKTDSWRSFMEAEDVRQELTIQFYKWFLSYDCKRTTFTYFFTKNCEFFFRNLRRKSMTEYKKQNSTSVGFFSEDVLEMQESVLFEDTMGHNLQTDVLLQEAGINTFPMLSSLTELMMDGYKPQEIKKGLKETLDFCMDKSDGKIYRLFDSKRKKPLFDDTSDGKITHKSGRVLVKDNLVRLKSNDKLMNNKPRDVNQALRIIKQSLRIQKNKHPKKRNGWVGMASKRSEYCVKNNLDAIKGFLEGHNYRMSASGLVLTIINSEGKQVVNILSVYNGKVSCKKVFGESREKLVFDLSESDKFQTLVSEYKEESLVVKAAVQEIKSDIMSFVKDNNPDVVVEQNGNIGILFSYNGKRIARAYRIFTKETVGIQVRIHNGRKLDPMEVVSMEELSNRIGEVVKFYEHKASGGKKIKSNFKIKKVDGVNYMTSVIPDVNLVREDQKVLHGSLTEVSEILEAIGISEISEIRNMSDEDFIEQVKNNEKAFEEVIDLMVYITSAANRIFGEQRIKDKLKEITLKNEVRGYFKTQEYDRDSE